MDPHPLCDFCAVQRALVYCSSDAARLCLPCDSYVHSANALSRRHLRALVCDRCHSQPADARCLHCCLSLCQACTSCSTTHHHRQLSRYSGCPSFVDISRIFSDADHTAGVGGVNGSCSLDPGDDAMAGLIQGMEPVAKFDAWKPISSCFLSEFSSIAPPDGETNLAQLGCTPLKDPGICDENELCDGLDTGDTGFNLDSSDGMVCYQQYNLRNNLQPTGLDASFTETNLVADSNCQIENAPEVWKADQICFTQSPGRY